MTHAHKGQPSNGQQPRRQKKKHAGVTILVCVACSCSFFVAPLKNIYQNENPNDKENLEWGEEKATFNDTSVFWHPPSNLPTPEDF